MHMKTAVDDEKREVRYSNTNLGDGEHEANTIASIHQLVFLYKLTEGIASSSFGTHVASLAGVPPQVVARAESISTDFADKFLKKLAERQTSKLSLTAQADFAYLWKMVQGEVDVDAEPVRSRRALQLIASAARDTYIKA